MTVYLFCESRIDGEVALMCCFYIMLCFEVVIMINLNFNIWFQSMRGNFQPLSPTLNHFNSIQWTFEREHIRNRPHGVKILLAFTWDTIIQVVQCSSIGTCLTKLKISFYGVTNNKTSLPKDKLFIIQTASLTAQISFYSALSFSVPFLRFFYE